MDRLCFFIFTSFVEWNYSPTLQNYNTEVTNQG